MHAILRLTAATILSAAALAACGKKAEAPAETPAASTEAGPNAAPAADAAATPAREPHVINEGEAVDGEATLAAPASAPAGAVFDVDWTGPGNAADYIDIVPRGYTNMSGEISYVYVRDAVTVAKLKAPVAAGDYDIRYLAELKTGRVVKTVVPFTVAAATVTFDAPPTTASGGEPITVNWTGPNNEGDYIDIVPRGSAATSGEISYAYTSAGAAAQMKAPGKAGEYDIRYIMEGQPSRRIALVAPLTVTAAEATLEAPATAKKAASVDVSWTGPNREGDYVDLVPKGSTSTSGELAYFYTVNGARGALKTPEKAGHYDIRYILEAPGGRQILATSPLKVE
jgi:Ca-activated chloride channel family protein